MNITQEADYAVRAICILAKEGEGVKLDAKTIAERGSMPLRFLLKLLRKLIKAEIIKSYRGVNGGYALNKRREDINLRQVIEAVDGPIAINRCLNDSDFCNANNTDSCRIHYYLNKVQETLIKELEKISFETLSDK